MVPRLQTRIALPISLLLTVALAVGACGSNNGTLGGGTGSVRPSTQTTSQGGNGSANNTGNGGGSDATASQQVGAASTTAPLAVDAGAAALEQQMVSVIKKVNPSVVLIETDQGLGSGVVYDNKGDIVTNAHVTSGANSFKVTFSDGHSATGTLVGSYAPDDIAVIKVNDGKATPATFADSAQVQVGQVVLAMGNPLGLQSSVTQGIISAVGRQVTEPSGNVLPDVIQTSAPINPGNSGGALVDLKGQVVGIPTLAATDAQLGGAANGIGFAISSNRAKDLAAQLIQSGKVTNSGRAFLGLQLSDTNGQGVLVYSVVSGGPASKAGVKQGDVITSINGTATPSLSELQQVMIKLKPGDTAKLQVDRQDGSHATLNVTLGQMPG